YRRNYLEGGTYFFTVNLLDRKKTLLVDYVDYLRESVAKVRRKRPFHTDACVSYLIICMRRRLCQKAMLIIRECWCEIKKAFNRYASPDEF
ncbi:transposase, partial [Cellvibrio mixtus]